jgi:hypothetical protein
MILKKGAVPSVFPNLPAYISSSAPEARSDGSTSSARREKTADRMEHAADKFLQEDEIDDLGALRQNLDRSCMPSGITEVYQNDELYFLSFLKDETSGPKVTFSLVITENMEVMLYSHGVQMSLNSIAHITGLGSINKCSQVLNILSFLKAFSESSPPATDTLKQCITLVKTLIPHADDNLARKLMFIAEQLNLATKGPKNRRYSSLLLATTVLWDNVSPALYHQIVAEDLLTLPGEKWVRRLSAGLSMGTGLPPATLDYLRSRIKTLQDREKLTSIIINEVYSARRVEYQNRKFYGFENSEAAKTLLCFMVKSIAGKYSDIVAMVPLTKISSEIINNWYQKVLEAVTEIGFDIVATLTDAHSSNRRFFQHELCKGKLSTFVPIPYSPGTKVFLMFDSVHIFKNIYNNLLNRRAFLCPPFEGKTISASFKHVEDVFKKEMGKPVKYAHKLSDKVLAPQPIERTKVELADRFLFMIPPLTAWSIGTLRMQK